MRKRPKKMINMIWPLALVVCANTFYQICSKSVPAEMNPFASLTITYVIGAIFSLGAFYLMNPSGNILQEYSKVNWAPFFLGVDIIALEVGWIYAYKNGWKVSTGSIVQAAVLSGILTIVGFLLYGEKITWNKVLGVVVCLCGLGLINWK